MGPILLGFTASNSYVAGGNSGEKVRVINVWQYMKCRHLPNF